MKSSFILAATLILSLSACNRQTDSVKSKPESVANNAQVIHFSEITQKSGYNDLSKGYESGDWQKVATFYKGLPEKYNGNDLAVLQRMSLTLLMSSKKWTGYGLVDDYSAQAKQDFAYFAQEYERLGVYSMPTSTDVLKRMATIWESPRVRNLKQSILDKISTNASKSIEEIEDKAFKELKALQF